MKKKNTQKQSKNTIKWRENHWMVSTVVLVIFLLIVLVPQFSQFKEQQEYNLTREQTICSEITATPAWVQGNKVIDYGYQSFGNQSIDAVNELLIPNQIEFYYSEDCGWCHKQIEYFGNTWDDYVASNLTIDCKKILS